MSREAKKSAPSAWRGRPTGGVDAWLGRWVLLAVLVFAALMLAHFAFGGASHSVMEVNAPVSHSLPGSSGAADET